MARVNLSHFKVLELPVDPQPDSIYYILDEENNIAEWYVTTSEGVPIPASDAAAVDALIDTATADLVNKTWTIVESAASSVTVTPADSGKYYRLSHNSPVFIVPNSNAPNMVAGKTHFYITFTGSSGGTGNINSADEMAVFDYMLNDGGYFTGLSTDHLGNMMTFTLFHLRYIGNNRWATNIISLA